MAGKKSSTKGTSRTSKRIESSDLGEGAQTTQVDGNVGSQNSDLVNDDNAGNRASSTDRDTNLGRDTDTDTDSDTEIR